MSSIFEKREKSLEDEYFNRVTTQFRHNANAVHIFAIEIGEHLGWAEKAIEDYGHALLDVFSNKGNTDAVVAYAKKDLEAKNATTTRQQLEEFMKNALEKAV